MISCSENNKLENVNKILLFGDSLMSGYGLKEDQIKEVMRKNLRKGSYRSWRKRVKTFSDRREFYK